MKSPLAVLWKFLSQIGAIVGLSSIMERLAQDFVSWQGFIADILGQYRVLISLLTNWVPFEL
ncbi:hypothetical protein [Maritalea sp.]|uniref:hypothetical protein n=1 Tax=Maritalea sp. TaxID=2003361 RepID=UPI003EF9E3DB